MMRVITKMADTIFFILVLWMILPIAVADFIVMSVKDLLKST